MNSNYKILVVDDSDDNRDATGELLSAMGYTVETAGNGQEALDKIAGYQPDLFLLDIVMPQMSGLELLEKLNVKENIFEAIMMTGHESLEDAKRAMERGAFGYISKPIKEDVLGNTIDKALSLVSLKKKRIEHLRSLEEKMIKKTHELEMTLQIINNQNQRLDAIINGMEEGLLAVDTKEDIVLINNQAQRILAVNSGECIGRNIREAVKDENICHTLRYLIRNKKEFNPEARYISIRYENNKTSDFYMNSSEIVDERGVSIGTIIVFVDQTEKINAERINNAFLTIVAHELRTPVNVFMNNLTLLDLYGDNKETRKEILHDMEVISTRFNYLVNNIVHIAGLSGSSHEVFTEEIDIVKIVNNEIEKHEIEITDKSLVVRINNNLENNRIAGDSKLLKIAVGCLLSNAIKFNKQNGAITIELNMSMKEGNRFLIFTITDTGIGMTPEIKNGLFSRYFQGEDPMTRRHGGLGTGLYLVERAANILGGTIEVSSVEGEGSVFCLKVPLKK